jgi:hypothetical protein
MIDKMILAAVEATIDLSPERGRAALENGPHRPAMGSKDRAAKLPFVLRPMLPQNFGQGRHQAASTL